MEKKEKNKQEVVLSDLLVRKVSSRQYAVESQSSDRDYNVVATTTGVWGCECKDFLRRLRTQRDKHCKHIRACIRHWDAPAKAGKKGKKLPVPKAVPRCTKCGSEDTVRSGKRKTGGGTKQMYSCKGCRHRFVPPEFARMRSEPETIASVLNMVMSSMTYRGVVQHIKAHQPDREISVGTVRNWVAKYSDSIREFVDGLEPELGNTWSADEMWLNVKNIGEIVDPADPDKDTEALDIRRLKKKYGKRNYVYLWSVVDPETRFVIATNITRTRMLEDARRILKKALCMSRTRPDYVVTDSLGAYARAVLKEMGNGTLHVPTKAIKNEFSNLPIERYHNELRERLKARRGLGDMESAQQFVDLLRIHHNFVRPHQGLGGKTPAQAAGIRLALGENAYLNLIRMAADPNAVAFEDLADAKEPAEEPVEPDSAITFDNATCEEDRPVVTFVPDGDPEPARPDNDVADVVADLGGMAERVDVANDGDSVNVTPKGWLDDWREINDILRRHRFYWLSDGRKGCWFRPSDTRPNFVSNLGKRIEKVAVYREGGSIRIRPRTYIHKKTWREINDILRLYKFQWQSNGKDGCWTGEPLQG